MIVEATVSNLRRSLSEARRLLYTAGDPEGFHAARIYRITRLLPRVIKHGRVMRSLKKLRAGRQRQIAEIKEAKRKFDSGVPFLCFDTEWHRETQETQEVGFTRFDRFGYETHNFRVAGVQNIDLPNFSYGETKVASMQVIQIHLQMAARGVFHFVGHSLSSDILQLRKHGINMTSTRRYDTAYWSTIHSRTSGHLSLGTLGEFYGMSSDVLHCAGNDSRYNAELFVKMLRKHG